MHHGHIWEESSEKNTQPRRIAVSAYGMVASAHYRATHAGRRILEAGGNAIDAAVATAFALGVCEPWASGLGGQTMMMIYRRDTHLTTALDGCSRAPQAVVAGTLNRRDCLYGHLASTTPSTPATLDYARRNFGTMTLEQLLDPAIDLATEGYEVGELQHRLAERESERLRSGSASRFYLLQGNAPHPRGAILRQPVLAKTLSRLAVNGIEDFYEGEVARDLVTDMEHNHGLIRHEDLRNIPWPVERQPISTFFGEDEVTTLPPPGAGNALLDMIGALRPLPEGLWNVETPRGATALATVIRESILNRRYRPFDPDFPKRLHFEEMLNPDYGTLVAHRVRNRRGRLRTGGETTHLSVMDGYGNAVSLTQSIERAFGSCAASPRLGFLYNNYMSSFEFHDILHPNYLRPKALPWVCMAPTIVFRDKQPWLALGSPGSERIAPAILQVLLRLRRQSPYDAVAGPRLHCTSTGKVSLESSRMRRDIPVALAEHGFSVRPRAPYSFYLGSVQLVMRNGGEFIGVADPRRDGSAEGPSNMPFRSTRL